MHRLRCGVSIASFLTITLTSVDCTGDRTNAAGWDGVVRDSAGIQIVENRGSPTWADGEGWTLSEVLRIGEPEGDAEYTFGRIGGVAVLSDLRIVVSDATTQQLRFFSLAGVHERTVGGRGSGPGEYRALGSIAVTAGDTLLIPDRLNLRLNRVAPDGRWLESFRVDAEQWPGLWRQTPSGRLASTVSVASYVLVGEEPTLTPIVSRTAKGLISDTLGWLPPAGFYSVSGGAQQFRYYPGEPSFCLPWDGGLVTAHGDDYEFMRYDAAGELVQVVRLLRENQPITDRDRELLFARVEAVLKARNQPPERFARRKSWTSFTDTYPAFRRFACGPSGTIWVQQVRPWTALTPEELDVASIAGTPPDSRDWDVFDAGGRYLGVVTMPARFQLWLFRGDVIYGVGRDELDVEYVVGLRIEGLPQEAQGG